jgi:hypothetical protein
MAADGIGRLVSQSLASRGCFSAGGASLRAGWLLSRMCFSLWLHARCGTQVETARPPHIPCGEMRGFVRIDDGKGMALGIWGRPEKP